MDDNLSHRPFGGDINISLGALWNWKSDEQDEEKQAKKAFVKMILPS